MKTLFALSGNVCGFADDDRGACEEVLTDPSWERVKARICHIRGLRHGAARHDPEMTDDERMAFDNLLLLCPNHHALVDELEPHRYPPEALERMKHRSELRGQERIWTTDAELDRIASLLLGQIGSEAEPSPQEENTTDWHVDMAVIWDKEGGTTRHTLSWAPGVGFDDYAGSDRTLDGLGGSPAPADLPFQAISVMHDAHRYLRFDFVPPIRPVAAFLHSAANTHKHDESEKPQPGQRGYLAFRLDRIG